MSAPSRLRVALAAAVVVAAAFAVSLGTVPGCNRAPKNAADSLAARQKQGERLRRTLERGDLVILTRNAPTTCYNGIRDYEGFEYALASVFAERLGVDVDIEFKDTVGEILEALARGEGHIAAAGLTYTPERAERFLAGPVYDTVRQQVVSRRGNTRPRKPADLVGREITVVANSSYVKRLEELGEEYPELVWEVTEDEDTEQLLQDVWNEKLDLTIADDNIVAINRRYFPELIVAFHLTQPESLVWYFHPEMKDLWKKACEWVEEYRASGRLERVHERYYGFVTSYDYVDTREFIERIETRLPKYRKLFEKVAKEYAVRWTIPAAIAYQESHWRPKAVSPTGVRGMMMLTQATAQEVGVEDRLDPEQSVRGGMEYLWSILARMPETIPFPDRYWATLAAYNVGYYHLMDARTLAKRLNRNPDRWADLAEVLPLLAQKQYYKTLPYGYARGYEPVLYVTRIRNYEDILRRELGLPGG